MSTFRIDGRCSWAAAAVLLALLAFAAPAAIAAEGERVLDPRLSLIGGCLEETLDPVEDPGCPDTPPAGEHPPAVFAFPRAVVTDFYGNVYVANWGKKDNGSEGRIDIFDSGGRFITEMPLEVPAALAVDSTGKLYVWAYSGKLLRFDPCAPYDPTTGNIKYCEPPSEVPPAGPDCSSLCTGRDVFGYRSLAVNPNNDHLFVSRAGQVVEYAAAAEDNEEVRSVTYSNSGNGYGSGVALDSVRQKLYVQQGGNTIEIFDLAEGQPAQEEPQKIGEIEASAVPEKKFGSTLSLAVDEGTGDLFVYDSERAHLWEFDDEGNYVATVEFPFEALVSTMISVDNGPFSPNGKLSEEDGKGRYLYVPSHPRKTPGHLFAFFASITTAPEVRSTEAANIGEGEAELQAVVDPGNLSTNYTFEVRADGAPDWIQVGFGTLAAGNLEVEVSASAIGLSPGTHYSFRVVAGNERGSDEAEGSFATYPSSSAEPSPCSNALLRTGASALLPDCRAYELVTPPDTNGHAPAGALGEGGGFSTRQVSPAGDKVPFRIVGGALPGFDAAGSLVGDPYLATRTDSGWSTSLIGPSGTEASSSGPGTTSPDQGYSFWGAAYAGTAVVEGKFTFYVRYPDGHSELLGQGSLGIDPEVTGRLITEGGGHIIFNTGSRPGAAVQLEPEAAPDGTQAVYDRTPDGITHVVSLKPGNVPFATGEAASFKGASPDGVGVAFVSESILYLRYNNAETFEIAENAQFAGVAEGGSRVFYVEDGDLKAFDVATHGVIEFADTVAKVVPVTISEDGSTAYFLSESAISGSAPNSEGAKPKAGGQNLYRSEEGNIAFIGTVTERDVVGEIGGFDGLGLLSDAFNGVPSGLGEVPARSTPDGAALLFKSRAPLTAYDSEGHAEIYRYDSAAKTLRCLSCNPTGAPAHSDATLQSPEVGTTLVWPENLRPDGRRAFFESREPLVARDGDGFLDVYEWEDQGVGSCSQPGGCLYLISSPQSRSDEYLWAVSRSGDDVFFRSADLLVGTDSGETPSIYDARVGGGFAEPKPGVCEGEGCRSQLAAPPTLPTGDTSVKDAVGIVKPRPCGKGMRKVKRGGKVRCVKKKRHRSHGKHRRGHGGQKGGNR